VTFKTLGVSELLRRRRKTVSSRRTSEGETAFAKFQPRFWFKQCASCRLLLPTNTNVGVGRQQ